MTLAPRCRRIIVTVPARNEEAVVAACLASIDHAARLVPVRVSVVLGADSCTDATVARALAAAPSHIGLDVLEGAWGRAGAVRGAAVCHALDLVARSEPALRLREIWIANTDADCTVPADWLRTQWELSGHHGAVAGTVALDPLTTPADLYAAFRQTYLTDGLTHTHVHGANLGLRADLYAGAGGWCPRTTVGEDHALWNAVSRLGASVAHSTALPVVTSARTRSRVRGGFACDLLALRSAAGLATGANIDLVTADG